MSRKLVQGRSEVRVRRRERVGISAVVLCKGSFLITPLIGCARRYASLVERSGLKADAHLLQLRAIEDVPRRWPRPDAIFADRCMGQDPTERLITQGRAIVLATKLPSLLE
jgi:hypothetical protein